MLCNSFIGFHLQMRQQILIKLRFQIYVHKALNCLSSCAVVFCPYMVVWHNDASLLAKPQKPANNVFFKLVVAKESFCCEEMIHLTPL